MTYAELRQLMHYADGCQTVDEFMSGVSEQLTENAADDLFTDVWKFHDNHTYRTLVNISGIPNRQIAIRYNILTELLRIGAPNLEKSRHICWICWRRM